MTSLVLADGATVSPRVVAVVSDSSAPAGLLLDRTAVRAHDPSALTSVVYLSGVAPGRSAVGARVVDVATYAAEADADEDRLVWLFTLLLVAVSAGYGSIAVASTLLMAAAARRRDFRVLRLSGASKRQVSFMVAAESAVVVAIGSVLGGAIAFIALLGGVAALRQQVGAPVDVVVPWDTVAAVVFTCLTLAVIASVVPTRR
jgi:putative ABC transport system permease protein